jgi:hypothetical protein
MISRTVYDAKEHDRVIEEANKQGHRLVGDFRLTEIDSRFLPYNRLLVFETTADRGEQK